MQEHNKKIQLQPSIYDAILMAVAALLMAAALLAVSND